MCLTMSGRIQHATRCSTLWTGTHILNPSSDANFLFVDVGDDAPSLFDALLHQGAIVRPMGGFGAPGALRITVGTPDENAFFAEALASVRAATT